MDAFPALCMNADPSDRGLLRLLPVTQPGPFSFENRDSATLRLPPAAHNRPCSTLMTRGPLSDCDSNRRRYSNVGRAPTSAGRDLSGASLSSVSWTEMQFTAIRLHSRGGEGRGGEGGRRRRVHGEERVPGAHRGGAHSACVCVHKCEIYKKCEKHEWQCLNKFPQQLLCDGRLHADA